MKCFFRNILKSILTCINVVGYTYIYLWWIFVDAVVMVYVVVNYCDDVVSCCGVVMRCWYCDVVLLWGYVVRSMRRWSVVLMSLWTSVCNNQHQRVPQVTQLGFVSRGQPLMATLMRDTPEWHTRPIEPALPPPPAVYFAVYVIQNIALWDRICYTWCGADSVCVCVFVCWSVITQSLSKAHATNIKLWGMSLKDKLYQ